MKKDLTINTSWFNASWLVPESNSETEKMTYLEVPRHVNQIKFIWRAPFKAKYLCSFSNKFSVMICIINPAPSVGPLQTYLTTAEIMKWISCRCVGSNSMFLRPLLTSERWTMGTTQFYHVNRDGRSTGMTCWILIGQWCPIINAEPCILM